MKLGIAVCGAFVVGASLALIAATPWQDAKNKDEKGAGGFSAEEMAMWMKIATPGPQHAEMAKIAGKWNVSGEWTMGPGAPPDSTKGTADFKMIFDGRYLVQELSTTSSQGPFHGMGISAYNNATGKFEDVWCDDMGTGLFFSTGEQKGDVLAYKGEMFDPMTKSMSAMRYDMRHSGQDEFSMDMYCTQSGKPEYKCMTLKYTRAAAGAR